MSGFFYFIIVRLQSGKLEFINNHIPFMKFLIKLIVFRD